MDYELSRARKLAQELKSGYVILDNQLSEEIATVLEQLVVSLEAQRIKIEAAEFALNYYREPNLYYAHREAHSQPILDGGLRARTALSEINRAHQHPLPVRVPLPDIE